MTGGSDVSHRVQDAKKLVMYSTVWCGYCRRLKSQLDRAGIDFIEVDIAADPTAAAFVEGVNNGNQTVPTVLLPNGTALSNPSITELTSALTATA
jgi:mycoredoxin